MALNQRVTRAERERRHGITTYQRGKVRAFAEEIAAVTGADYAYIYADLERRVMERGFANFKAMRAHWFDLRKNGKARFDALSKSERAEYKLEVAEQIEAVQQGWEIWHHRGGIFLEPLKRPRFIKFLVEPWRA
jgi:hypothetical protein